MAGVLAGDINGFSDLLISVQCCFITMSFDALLRIVPMKGKVIKQKKILVLQSGMRGKNTSTTFSNSVGLLETLTEKDFRSLLK